MNVFLPMQVLFYSSKIWIQSGPKKTDQTPAWLVTPNGVLVRVSPQKMALQIWFRIYSPEVYQFALPKSYRTVTPIGSQIVFQPPPRFGGIRRNEAWKLWQSVLDGCVPPKKTKATLGQKPKNQKKHGKMQVFFFPGLKIWSHKFITSI